METHGDNQKLETKKYKGILDNVWLNVCKYYQYTVEDGNKLVGKLKGGEKKTGDKKAGNGGDEMIQENKKVDTETAPMNNFDVMDELGMSEVWSSDDEGLSKGEKKKKRKAKKKAGAEKSEAVTQDPQALKPPGSLMDLVWGILNMVWQVGKTFFLFQAAYMVLTWLSR